MLFPLCQSPRFTISCTMELILFSWYQVFADQLTFELWFTTAVVRGLEEGKLEVENVALFPEF